MAHNSNLAPILKAIALKKQELESELAPGGQLDGFDGLTSDQKFVKNLDPQVCDLYRGVAKVMARFRSGQPPKAFKIIPNLANWEQILELTEPNNWTAASVYEATKLFASNLKNDMAQKFYNIILLPRLRDDINEYKKLNFHMYNALKRSLYKPAAFYKGIILPLCEDSAEASLREAVIISSIIKRTHVPLMHSAAALLKIAEMPHSPVRCVFMMDLISKNYALPFRVLDALVDHFNRYTYDESFEPNVQWHQTLLKFCQLYARDISSEQKEALLELIKHHTHPQISPEIRKVLQKTKPRDVELSQQERMELVDEAADNEENDVDDDDDEDFDDVDDDDDDDVDDKDEDDSGEMIE
uniref:Bystin n=1 Tax=Aceria tosichella TaxID=561515 RepID=A0A6G1SKP6_9ACAR